jgi:hypothetical protein
LAGLSTKSQIAPLFDTRTIRHEKMKPEPEKELLFRRGKSRLSGPNRHLRRFPPGRLSGRNRSGVQSEPHGKKTQPVH